MPKKSKYTKKVLKLTGRWGLVFYRRKMMKGVLIRLCFVHMLGKGQLKSKKLCGKSRMPTATQIIPKIRTVIRDISIRFLCPVPLPCLLVFFLNKEIHIFHFIKLIHVQLSGSIYGKFITILH